MPRFNAFAGPESSYRRKDKNGALLRRQRARQGSNGRTSEGEVLVIDGGGSLRTALMGDQIAGAGSANGWAGAIVFGAIGDSVAIDALAFHVKALGTNPRKSSKTGAGECEVVVEFGGVRFIPGWFLYSDVDGVVVLVELLS